MAATYAAVRVAIAVIAGPYRDHFDTIGYRQRVSFVGGSTRPWAVTLPLHAFGDWAFVIFQAGLGGVAFVVLARALAATVFHPQVKIGVATVVLLLGLSSHVTPWDSTILSESMALSMTAFLIACLAHLSRVPWWTTAVTFTLWVFTREAHVYVGLFVLAGILVWGAIVRTWILPAAVLVAMLWAGLAYSNDDTVEGLNVTLNVAWYAGTDVETFRWFVDQGMPSPAGFYSSDYSRRWELLYHDEEFREWAEGAGRDIYVRYLAAHPGFVLSGFRGLVEGNDRENQTVFDQSGFEVANTFAVDVLWPGDGEMFTLALIAVSVLVMLLAWCRPCRRSRWVVPMAMLASTFPHALLAYHAVPSEIARHGTVLAFVAVVAAWWAIALGVDVLSIGRSANRDGAGVDVAHPGAVIRRKNRCDPPSTAGSTVSSEPNPMAAPNHNSL